MFTGIIECAGAIVQSRQTAGGRRLCVRVGPIAHESKLGDSVCVSGVCLTVAHLSDDRLEFDVIRETLDKTTLGQKRPGDRVNLERSLRVGDRLDGHFVQGHVDGTAEVDRVLASPREHVVFLRPQSHLVPYIIPKGSITVDGVSLTIAEVAASAFSIALIPTTLERTTLGDLRAGQRVNLESDIIARTIVHSLNQLADTPQGIAGSALRSVPRVAGSGVASGLVPDAHSPSPSQGERTRIPCSTTLTLDSLQKAGFL